MQPSPTILCAMRMPPNPNGHGGSQRAWWLLQALRRHGRVHFVLLYRDQDMDCVSTSLAPLESSCESVTRVEIRGWRGATRRKWGVIPGKIQDLAAMRSHEAPQLSRREIASIAERLPLKRFDMVFAGRLCCAWIVQALIDQGHLSTDRKFVDFDDLMSKFRRRQSLASGASVSTPVRALMRLDAWLIAKAERQIAHSWHGVSVCTDDDVAATRLLGGSATVAKIPNVVDRDYLAPRAPDERFRLLFVGNLGFSANYTGLLAFIREAWPTLLAAVPEATLTIVGFNPPDELARLARELHFELHSSVPDVRSYYADCDVLIVPILFGSGTRIKILESMAYGRAVVSTTMGAEGMGLQDGSQVLMGETMQALATALQSLARDPGARSRLVANARAYQQAHYTPAAFAIAVDGFLGGSAKEGERAR